MKTIIGNSGNVTKKWSNEISRMWKKDNVPIDWSRARQRYGIAIKNMDGDPVSDFSGWNWFGENPDQWYPQQHLTFARLRSRIYISTSAISSHILTIEH